MVGLEASADVPSQSSFDDFVRARAGALARTAFLLAGDRHHAEDLVQTALAKAAVHWHRLHDPEAYVRRALYTQAVSWWRVRRRRSSEVLVEFPPDPPTARPADPETRIVLGQALARLTAKQRAVLVLRFYEDRDGRHGEEPDPARAAPPAGTRPGAERVDDRQRV